MRIASNRQWTDMLGDTFQFVMEPGRIAAIAALYDWLEQQGREYVGVNDPEIGLVIQTHDSALAVLFKLTWGGDA